MIGMLDFVSVFAGQHDSELLPLFFKIDFESEGSSKLEGMATVKGLVLSINASGGTLLHQPGGDRRLEALKRFLFRLVSPARRV
ncbi:hypothetical protein ES703_55844 [subsurface metagenome]